MVAKYFAVCVAYETQDIEKTTQLINIILFALNKNTSLDEYLMIDALLKWNGSRLFNAQNVEIVMVANRNIKSIRVICLCESVVKVFLRLSVSI